jgi:pyruvate/2-oxoglutarate dehydrogenase complex dihydrolipoamide acyltransferase (E2) component
MYGAFLMAAKRERGFTIVPFPKRRRLVTDLGWLSRSRHSIRGLVEVDVTEARSQIRRYRRECGKPLSFTAFLVATVARAVSLHKEVNASHAGNGKIAYFDDVHVLTMIEIVNTDGMKLPIGHLIGSADKLGPLQIEEEIEKFRATYNEASETKMIDFFTSFPPFLRRLLFARMPRNPEFVKKNIGTVFVSSVGMFIPHHAAWALGQANNTVSIWVGGISERIREINGEMTPRDIACITIDLDHDIVDGAPAARFAATLIEMIEKASILKGG